MMTSNTERLSERGKGLRQGMNDKGSSFSDVGWEWVALRSVEKHGFRAHIVILH
jgi:hypothetical protein